MAKIEIQVKPEELQRISTFLSNNNIDYLIVDDYGNHSKEDTDKYRKLITGAK
ncbi:hypothetical protein N9954_02800 [Maribacter sp.]|nr:hypothetical protein [Maribacter sp.]